VLLEEIKTTKKKLAPNRKSRKSRSRSSISSSRSSRRSRRIWPGRRWVGPRRKEPVAHRQHSFGDPRGDTAPAGQEDKAIRGAEKADLEVSQKKAIFAAQIEELKK